MYARGETATEAADFAPAVPESFAVRGAARSISVGPRRVRVGCRAVAIRANHLHAAAVGSQQIRLQVAVMIELNSSRIAVPAAQHGKFRMIALKAIDVARESRRAVARRQIRMALRAVRVARGRQSNRSAMIGVAGGARRRELLRRVMNGAVVAGEAFLVGDFLAEKSRLRDVARGALPGQHRVRGRQRARRINAPVAAHSVPREPHERERRQRHRQPKRPASQRARPLEIFQVDPLREFLGCACSRHVETLAPIPSGCEQGSRRKSILEPS